MTKWAHFCFWRSISITCKIGIYGIGLSSYILHGRRKNWLFDIKLQVSINTFWAVYFIPNKAYVKAWYNQTMKLRWKLEKVFAQKDKISPFPPSMPKSKRRRTGKRKEFCVTWIDVMGFSTKRSLMKCARRTSIPKASEEVDHTTTTNPYYPTFKVSFRSTTKIFLWDPVIHKQCNFYAVKLPASICKGEIIEKVSVPKEAKRMNGCACEEKE